MKLNFMLCFICVLALTTSGCFSSKNHGPSANISAAPMEGSAPLNVSFQELVMQGDANIKSREWDFGDGYTSSQLNPRHTYKEPGEYTVKFTVWDENGMDARSEIVVKVHPEGYSQPEASYTADPKAGPAPLKVKFTDTSSDPGGSIVSWDWDFDDGETSDLQNPSHIFDDVGTYRVRLTVTDDDGLTDTYSSIIVTRGYIISIFNSTEDTYVDETRPDSNFGKYTFVKVNDDCEIYLKFTGLPAADTIRKAEVKLYNTFRMENGPEVEALTTSFYWDEKTVTWNNGMTSAIGSLDTTLANGTQQWFSWDVTEGVKFDMSSGTVTIILRAVTSGNAQFYTRENDNIYIPKLELTLTS